MSASNFGDSMEWGRGRSFGSRKGKRAAGSSSDKPRQPQRGLGVAQLEKIRIQSEMAGGYLHHPTLGQPPLSIHGTGSLHMEADARSSNSLPSSPSSCHADINVSSPYSIHPNLVMANGGRGDIRYVGSQSTPIIWSPPNYHGSTYGGADYSNPCNDATLPLFEPEESIFLKEQHDHCQSVDSSASMNSDDPPDVDLELKL